jgi:hypothetical protein
MLLSRDFLGVAVQMKCGEDAALLPVSGKMPSVSETGARPPLSWALG